MNGLRTPDLPEGNLYEQLKEMAADDPDAQLILRAVQGAFRKFHIREETWDIIGNPVIRYVCLTLANKGLTIEDKDKDNPMWVNLKKLGDEIVARLGDDPPVLKFNRQQGGE